MASGVSSISRAPRPSSLADVLDLILDKGLVIDAYVRVSLAGIEVLTIDARVVVASVDTYLRFAEAVNRLDLGKTEEKGLPALFGKDRNGSEDENGSRENGNGGGSRRREVGQGSQRRALQGGGDRERSRGQSDNRGRDDHDEDGGNVLGRIAERARR